MTALTQDLGNIRAVGVQGTVQGQDPYFDWNFRKISKPIVRAKLNGGESYTRYPSSHNFLRTLGSLGSIIQPDYDHIYYTQEVTYTNVNHVGYIDQYYVQNSVGQGYIQCQEAIPWLWRNMEPFYIENPNSEESITIQWTSLDFYNSGSTNRYVWANIIMNAQGEIQSVDISDNFNDPGLPIGKQNSKLITLAPGSKIYIFRIDTNQNFIYTPEDWVDIQSGYAWQIGMYDNQGHNQEANYWTPGVAFFVLRKPSDTLISYQRASADVGYRDPIIKASSKFTVGGCLASLYLPCAVAGYETIVNPDAQHMQAGREFAQDIFESTNISIKSWVNQQVSFCADGLFATSNVKDASRLELPIIVPHLGLFALFSDCLSLVNPPKELPALTIYPTSYGRMFYNCTSLTESPIIYANRMLPFPNNYVLAHGSQHEIDRTFNNEFVNIKYKIEDDETYEFGICFLGCENLQSIYLKGGNWCAQGNTAYPCFVQGVKMNGDWDIIDTHKIPTPFIKYGGKGWEHTVNIYMRQNVRLYVNYLYGDTYTNNGQLPVEGYPPTSLPIPNSNLRVVDYIVNDSQYIANIYNIDDPQYHLQN